jgi:hypothetical protein
VDCQDEQKDCTDFHSQGYVEVIVDLGIENGRDRVDVVARDHNKLNEDFGIDLVLLDTLDCDSSEDTVPNERVVDSDSRGEGVVDYDSREGYVPNERVVDSDSRDEGVVDYDNREGYDSRDEGVVDSDSRDEGVVDSDSRDEGVVDSDCRDEGVVDSQCRNEG